MTRRTRILTASKDLKQPFCTGQRASTIALVRREASLAGVSLSAFVEAAIAAYCDAIEQVGKFRNGRIAACDLKMVRGKVVGMEERAGNFNDFGGQ